MKQCKIIVKDEVNVKLEGLELADRKTLMKMFEYEKPGARYLPSVRLGRWNGKLSYFSIGGATYLNLLPEIVPLLDQAGYDIELDDLRTYQTTFNFVQVSKDTFSKHKWPKGHPKENQPIELRDYQVEVINRFLSNPQSIQEVATGAGKTITTAVLSYSIQDYGRSIVIVPNKSLVTQTEEDYINVGLDVGVYFGDRKEWGKKHTICTWQSLNNLLKDTQSGKAEFTIADFIEDVVCVMVDEVHMAKADALKTLLTGVFSHVPIRWGLTGTIPKAKYEAQSLYVSLGNVIGKLSASELQDKGVLAQCHVNIVQLQDSVEFTNYQSELKHLLEDKNRLDTIANLISKIKESGNTLILVDRVNAGKELIDRLPGSVFISGETKLTERKEEYDEVATSDKKIIVATYGVASVGINIPRVFNLVLLEPGKSFVRVIQSIGRGIRKAEDKDFVQIWDITSSCKFAKRHLTQRKTFYKEANYPFDVEKLTYR
jgi:superfamily II DNA or RNA helicase